MDEQDASSTSDRRVWKVILAMLLLLVFTPFKLEIRLSTYHYPVISLSHFVFWSWTYVYSLAGYDEVGFITRPFYQIAQPGSLQTFFPFIFLLTLIGFQLGTVSRKDAIKVGYASFFPGVLVLTMNLVLSIFTPGSWSIIVPIPMPIASILGIMVLRRQEAEKVSKPWQSDH